MSNWRHSMCASCWKKGAAGRAPVKVDESLREWEKCCWCGRRHYSGIYVRDDPKTVPCKGEHK